MVMMNDEPWCFDKFWVAKNDLLICSHWRWYRETLRYCIWSREYSTCTPLREPNATSGAAAWLVDCWPWVSCQVDDDCPVGITCNLVWGPSLEQNHLFVPFWVEWLNDYWMMLFFLGGNESLEICWNKTGKRTERWNFNFRYGSFLDQRVSEK